MSEIVVMFACEHTKVFDDVRPDAEPVCPVCGSRTVARVTAPPPRFSGCAIAPYQKLRVEDSRGQ